ncbi:UTP--glucose-1-phosphate uridylyltransferase [Anoxybacter fermentans]|uniref:UTP--glucose-1-phosphate uridylyltransferase n=1 Tax=Anoxybacter fermentans TaxID=1323375 RepID=A0A3S9T2Z4_9FIRM|nr:UTP--glucose-1-phosphate uridylyltransferase GalU [Anoxybacter fermentans]AZR74909.1 UTP--glucose-1-phosphate uridylyltransferase [Anoxybacter fermentans]
MKIKTAVIPAAGLGTRFLPATKAQPKEMLPLVDKPTIQYIIEEAVEAGIEDIIIITGRGKRAIEDHFDKSFELEYTLEKRGKFDLLKEVQQISEMVRIHYVRQKEPLGLGHAIYCARLHVGNSPFAVLLGDDVIVGKTPAIGQMMKMYDQYKGAILAVSRVPKEDVSSYGILDAEQVNENLYRVKDMVEKPSPEEAPSNLAVIGRYILPPEIFDILESLPPGKDNEIQLTDAIKILNQTQQVYGFVCEGKRYDVGNIQGFLEATVELALMRPELKDSFASYLKEIVKTL